MLPSEFYRTFFDQTPLGLCVLSSEMDTIQCNAACAALLECCLLNPLVPDFVSDLEADKDESRLLDELCQGKRQSYQVSKQIPTKDGSTLWLRLTVTQLDPLSNGWRLAMLEDITASELTRRSLNQHNENLQYVISDRIQHLVNVQERTAAILDSSPDAIIFTRPSMEIMTANIAFKEQFGAPLDTYYNKPLTELIYPGDVLRMRQAFEEASIQQTQVRVEMRAVRHDRSIFDVEIALAPVLEKNKLAGIVCSIRDISVFKDIERMKDSLIATISHELNTPIANFRLYHHLLKAQPTKAEQYLEVMGKEIERLEAIVKEVIAISKLAQQGDNDQASPSEFNCLTDAIDEVVTMFREEIAHKSLGIITRCDADFCEVKGNADLINKAIRSLVGNAVRYTPSSGEIRITVINQTNDRGMPGVLMKIRDNGMGLSDEDKQNLFSRFYRGQAAARSASSGAGLSTCHHP